MDIIGEIKLKIGGNIVMTKITSDGYAVTPDGTQKKLSAESFAVIKKKLEAEAAPDEQATADEAETPNPTVEQKPEPKSTAESELKPEAKPAEQPTHQPEQALEKEQKKTEEKSESEKPAYPAARKADSNKIMLGMTLAMSVFTLLVVVFSLFVLPHFENADQPTPPASSESMDESDTAQGATGPLETPTQKELEEAKTILIVARIKTADGEEKEVILGYFTTDDDESMPELPDKADSGNESDDAGRDLESNSTAQQATDSDGGFINLANPAASA